tara:strand:+ start:1817 stop:3367 length:1551 start_codon:yes stop_codon:yes gene_type:complete
MVAVGSKSIPEKQSISLGLSNNSEDKLENDLFSDIFSSQETLKENINTNKENNVTNDLEISPFRQHDLELKDNEVKAKVSKNIEVEDDTLKIIDNIDISDINNISSALNLDKQFPKTEVNEYDFETEVSAEVKMISDYNETRDDLNIMSLGLLGTKIISKEGEDLIIENGEKNTDGIENLGINYGQNLNSIVNKMNHNKETLNNKKIKNGSNIVGRQPDLDNLKINIDNDLTNGTNVSGFKNNFNLEKNIHKNNDEVNIYNKDDFLNDIKVKKEDYSKIKKDNIIINENSLVSKKYITQNNLTNNTEKFFQTKYMNSINIHTPQGKNITNSQNNINNASLEISSFTQSSNLNSGNSNNQNNTQAQSNFNNLQLLNDMKESLDMSNKKWASNLVSRLNRANSSKINELEIVLTPKNLGKMKVKISLSDKTAFVKITTNNATASSLILEEQEKLSEMLKEVGLELEDFSSEQSFQDNFHNNKNQNKDNSEKTQKIQKLSDENSNENYIKEESILNIKV